MIPMPGMPESDVENDAREGGNAKGKSNWTPLRWAKARKRHDIVNILESAGAKQ